MGDGACGTDGGGDAVGLVLRGDHDGDPLGPRSLPHVVKPIYVPDQPRTEAATNLDLDMTERGRAVTERGRAAAPARRVLSAG
ncbi:hypothetical protein GCM10022262_29340 [Georgenia daeguensis]|uniref:Uncharacterized protein n=1 Tax=Georgenia daeguensis TaxID=908355 RepID=A0ABP8EX52_9MICO